MTISDEAAQAAARAMLAAGNHVGGWEILPTFMQDQFMRDARAALEAAAPHMLAAAWAQGAQEGFDSSAEGFNGECAFEHCAPEHYPPTNPCSGEKWEVQDYQL